MEINGSSLGKFGLDQLPTPSFDTLAGFAFSSPSPLFSTSGCFDLPSGDAALNTPALIASIEKFDFSKLLPPSTGEYDIAKVKQYNLTQVVFIQT